MSALYETRVTAVGGRNGAVCSDDGLLELALALPRELGGRGNATNPEQLFAAGYAACFGNAVIHVARSKNTTIKDHDVRVAAKVGMIPNGIGAFSLTVALEVTIAGVAQAVAEQVVADAHKVCPYSNAVKGNIEVALSTRTS